jgi:hypothetical protein
VVAMHSTMAHAHARFLTSFPCSPFWTRLAPHLQADVKAMAQLEVELDSIAEGAPISSSSFPPSLLCGLPCPSLQSSLMVRAGHGWE